MSEETNTENPTVMQHIFALNRENDDLRAAIKILEGIIEREQETVRFWKQKAQDAEAGIERMLKEGGNTKTRYALRTTSSGKDWAKWATCNYWNGVNTPNLTSIEGLRYIWRTKEKAEEVKPQFEHALGVTLEVVEVI
jgi:hypothetical protein